MIETKLSVNDTRPDLMFYDKVRCSTVKVSGGACNRIAKQQKIVFVPISSIKKAVDEDGARPG